MNQILSTGVLFTPIHFTYEIDGKWRIACMPNMTEFHKTKHHPAYLRTNDTRAANCPACKNSSVFKECDRVTPA